MEPEPPVRPRPVLAGSAAAAAADHRAASRACAMGARGSPGDSVPRRHCASCCRCRRRRRRRHRRSRRRRRLGARLPALTDSYEAGEGELAPAVAGTPPSMVRETRHLWVGNLPENVREEKIIEHFKRWTLDC